MYKDYRGVLPKDKGFALFDAQTCKEVFGSVVQPSDPFYRENCNKNMNGWPCSDLQLVVKLQDQSAQEALLSRLTQRAENYCSPDMSVSDILDGVCPRSVQSYVEVSEFAKRLSELGFFKAKADLENSYKEPNSSGPVGKEPNSSDPVGEIIDGV